MANWWIEVWDIPGVGTSKKIAQLPVSRVSFTRQFNGIGSGTVAIPASYSRIHDINNPDSDTGSVMRVYLDGTLAYTIESDEMSEPYSDRAGALIDISGPGIESMVGWAIAYPYDYPELPTKFPDWRYGSDEVAGSFTNGSFEDDALEGNGGGETGNIAPFRPTSGSGFGSPNEGPDINEVGAHVRSGTKSIVTDPGARHTGFEFLLTDLQAGGRYQVQIYFKEPTASGLRYTAAIQVKSGYTVHHANGFVYNGYAMAELDNVARNPASNGEPGGSADGTFQVFDLDVTLGSSQTEAKVVVQFDDHIPAVQNGPEFYVDDITVTGPGFGLSPWEPITVQGGGTVDVFERDTVDGVTDGTYSCQFQVTSTVARRCGIRQHVTGLTPGGTYTFAVDIEHDQGTSEDFAIILKRPSGTFYTPADAFTVNAFTNIRRAVTIELGEDDDEVHIDIRHDETGASPNVFVDNAEFSPGLPATTVGAMMTDLLDDAAVDHAAEGAPGAPRTTLAHLKYDSWSDTQDSNGNNWTDSELSIDIPRGMRYTQVLGKIIEWGYEWEVVWNDGASQYELKIYNPGGMGVSGVARTILEGQSIRSGSIKHYVPERNHVFAEGAEGLWAEQADGTDQTNYERREFYVGDESATTQNTVTVLSQTQLSEFDNNLGVSITLDWDDNLLPFRDFDIGDTLAINFPDRGHTGQYRVRRITANLADTGENTFTVVLNSEVTEPFAAVSTAVNRLLEEFQPLTTPDASLDIAVGNPLVFEGPIEASLLIVGQDVPDALIDVADYVCDGVDDQEEISAAITELSDLGGGKLVMAGTFSCSAYTGQTTPVLDLSGDIHFEGLRAGSSWGTVIEVDDGSATPGGTVPAVRLGNSGFTHISDMQISVDSTAGAGTGYERAVEFQGKLATDLYILATDGGVGGRDILTMNADTSRMIRPLIESTQAGTGSGIQMLGGRVGTVIRDPILVDVEEHGILVDAAELDHQIYGVTSIDVGGKTTNTYDVVHIEDGADRIIVIGVDHATGGAATARYGVNVAGATSTDIIVGAVVGTGFQTGTINHTVNTMVLEYTRAQDDGTYIGQQPILNFTGAGVTVTDTPASDRLDIDIPGGGGGAAETYDKALLLGGM